MDRRRGGLPLLVSIEPVIQAPVILVDVAVSGELTVVDRDGRDLLEPGPGRGLRGGRGRRVGLQITVRHERLGRRGGPSTSSNRKCRVMHPREKEGDGDGDWRELREMGRDEGDTFFSFQF